MKAYRNHLPLTLLAVAAAVGPVPGLAQLPARRPPVEPAAGLPGRVVGPALRALPDRGAAPSGVAAQPAGPTSVRLSWNAASGATGYRVYRQAPGREWVELTAAPLAAPGYLDAGVAPNLSFAYRVSAQYADRAPGEADVAIKLPDAHPTHFAAREASPGTIEFAWTPLPGAKNYWIAGEAGAPGSGYAQRPDRHTVTGVPPGTYRYALLATFDVAGLGQVEANLQTAPRATVTVRPVVITGDGEKDFGGGKHGRSHATLNRATGGDRYLDELAPAGLYDGSGGLGAG